MAGRNPWKRGSKRRVAQIRWRRGQIVHAILLCLSMLGFCLWIGWWIATHPLD